MELDFFKLEEFSTVNKNHVNLIEELMRDSNVKEFLRVFNVIKNSAHDL